MNWFIKLFTWKLQTQELRLCQFLNSWTHAELRLHEMFACHDGDCLRLSDYRMTNSLLFMRERHDREHASPWSIRRAAFPDDIRKEGIVSVFFNVNRSDTCATLSLLCHHANSGTQLGGGEKILISCQNAWCSPTSQKCHRPTLQRNSLFLLSGCCDAFQGNFNFCALWQKNQLLEDFTHCCSQTKAKALRCPGWARLM